MWFQIKPLVIGLKCYSMLYKCGKVLNCVLLLLLAYHNDIYDEIRNLRIPIQFLILKVCLLGTLPYFSTPSFSFTQSSRLRGHCSLRSRKPKLYGDIKSRYPKITAAMEKLLYFWVEKSHKRAPNSRGILANWTNCLLYT